MSVGGVPRRRRKPAVAAGEDRAGLVEEQLAGGGDAVGVAHDDVVVRQVVRGDGEVVDGLAGFAECASVSCALHVRPFD